MVVEFILVTTDTLFVILAVFFHRVDIIVKLLDNNSKIVDGLSKLHDHGDESTKSNYRTNSLTDELEFFHDDHLPF